MNELTIRPCNGTDQDYELVVNVLRSVSDEPMSVSRLKEIDAWMPESGYRQRSLIYCRDRCIGATMHFYFAEQTGTSKQTIVFDLVPDWHGKGLEPEVLNRLIEQAQSHGATEVITGARDGQSAKLAAILDAGFVRRCSYSTSELDLERFDPEICRAKTESVLSQGIEILSSAQLAERGIDWLDQLYGFFNDPDLSLDEFKEKTSKSPGYFPESQFAAFDGEHVLGITSLRHQEDQPGCAHNDLTKVVFEMKRKGIATAMKCASLNAAHQLGIRKVRTCNESTNPMLILNRQLGFRQVYEDIEFVKNLVS